MSCCMFLFQHMFVCLLTTQLCTGMLDDFGAADYRYMLQQHATLTARQCSQPYDPHGHGEAYDALCKLRLQSLL